MSNCIDQAMLIILTSGGIFFIFLFYWKYLLCFTINLNMLIFQSKMDIIDLG